MRYFSLALLVLGLIVGPALGQVVTTSTPAPSTKSSEALPQYRPILMGEEANALINKIDRETVGERSPSDQEVMFYCIVNKNGKVVSSSTYRASPGSDALEHELRRRMDSSVFIPGVYDGKIVDAVYYGTATFRMVNGTPRLRIFSNQQFDEVAAESDFIGPQPYFGGDSKFLGFHYPKKANGKVNGLAELTLQVDDEGNVKEMKVTYEYPPDNGFADAAIADFTGAKFIPAFRDGKRVECTIQLPVFYRAKESGS